MNILKIESRWGKWSLFPESLKIYSLKISLYFLLLGVLFCNFGFSKIFHGAGIQMTNNGTGLYYKPGIPINTDSQIIGDIGFHFDNSIQSASIIGFENNKRSVLLNMSVGYRRELLKHMLAGVFRPVIILQGGGAANIYSFS